MKQVRRGEEFPSDIVFLRAQHDDPELCGLCHVQTAQLDGETNLKLRKAVPATVELLQTEAACANFSGHVKCEEPTEHFGKFSGVLYLSGEDQRGAPLDANQTLLRGCVLRNVEYVYGLVIYTGNETKVRVKQQDTTTKKAAVESEINKYIIGLVSAQIVFCLIGAIGYSVWTSASDDTHDYLQLPSVGVLDFIEKLLTFFLLNSQFVPISLYVSMKMARQVQKFFIEFDKYVPLVHVRWAVF